MKHTTVRNRKTRTARKRSNCLATVLATDSATTSDTKAAAAMHTYRGIGKIRPVAAAGGQGIRTRLAPSQPRYVRADEHSDTKERAHLLQDVEGRELATADRE